MLRERRRGRGFTLVEVVIGMIFASTFLVALENGFWQLSRLDTLAAEKLATTGVAQWAAREVLAAPSAILGVSDPGTALRQRLNDRELSLVSLEVHRRRLPDDLTQVTIVAVKRHPVLGAVEGKAVVIVRE
ncbi:MAG: hypothetical protein HY815_00165 [Candidatus Riflebacteria bacterium]|nr:hypothetical protein [Candidatus Riflebacteria bacterium]